MLTFDEAMEEILPIVRETATPAQNKETEEKLHKLVGAFTEEIKENERFDMLISMVMCAVFRDRMDVGSGMLTMFVNGLAVGRLMEQTNYDTGD